MLFEIIILLAFFRWVFYPTNHMLNLHMLNLHITNSLHNRCSLEIISMPFLVIVSMLIPIPGSTMLQETVSKYFNKRESRNQSVLVHGPRSGVAGPRGTVLDQLVYQTRQAIFWLYFQYAKRWNWFKANGTHWRWVTPNISVNVKWSDSRPFTLNRWIRGHLFR